MSHHYSGPDFSFPQGDARLDFTDLYAFLKSGDAGKSILIMNVHPSAGENPPGPTTTEPFAPQALYELKIDTDGDAIADIAYRVRFAAFERGAQTATCKRDARPLTWQRSTPSQSRGSISDRSTKSDGSFGSACWWPRQEMSGSSRKSLTAPQSCCRTSLEKIRILLDSSTASPAFPLAPPWNWS